MIDFVIIAGLSATTVGVMEYLKGFLSESLRAKVPSNVWRIVLLVVASGIVVAKGGQANDMIINGLAVVSLSQIGYEGFLKFLKNKVPAA